MSGFFRNFIKIGACLSLKDLTVSLMLLKQFLLFPLEAKHFDFSIDAFCLHKEHHEYICCYKKAQSAYVCPTRLEFGLEVGDCHVFFRVHGVGHENETIAIHEHEIAASKDEVLVVELELVLPRHLKRAHKSHKYYLESASESLCKKLSLWVILNVDNQRSQDHSTQKEAGKVKLWVKLFCFHREDQRAEFVCENFPPQNFSLSVKEKWYQKDCKHNYTHLGD